MASQTPDLTTIFEACIFAANKHQGHIRKDQKGSPYITHPLLVAQAIWKIGGVTDTNILVAAILHDTIEDTKTTLMEIQDTFGKSILDIVLEVTDDKSLPRQERKWLQVVHAPGLSHPARIIKLGDKLVNCRDILNSPPKEWTLERRQQYIQWAVDVLYRIRGTNIALEAAFDDTLTRAETQLDFSIQPFETIHLRPWAP
ncbi:MAG: HD domain-containing protein [Chloroflexota bacterium]|nr:HD domain-containing protein [Chloroflexota bacterium]